MLFNIRILCSMIFLKVLVVDESVEVMFVIWYLLSVSISGIEERGALDDFLPKHGLVRSISG